MYNIKAIYIDFGETTDYVVLIVTEDLFSMFHFILHIQHQSSIYILNLPTLTAATLKVK